MLKFCGDPKTYFHSNVDAIIHIIHYEDYYENIYSIANEVSNQVADAQLSHLYNFDQKDFRNSFFALCHKS